MTTQKMVIRVVYYHGSSGETSSCFADPQEAAWWARSPEGRCACVYDLVTSSRDPMIARLGGDSPFVSSHTRVARLFVAALQKHYDERHLIVHQADSGSWLLDYAPGDPANEKNIGVFGSRAEADRKKDSICRCQMVPIPASR